MLLRNERGLWWLAEESPFGRIDLDENWEILSKKRIVLKQRELSARHHSAFCCSHI